jgi:hypothetical protein
MVQSVGFKNADKEKLANRLYGLSEMAMQFSEKEEESKEQQKIEVSRPGQRRRV